MRNSSAIAAGVPAPFTDLTALRQYLDLLEAVVANTADRVALDKYVAFDRDSFTPVANVRWQPYGNYTFNSCILYDSVKGCIDSGHSDAHVRNASRVVLNLLVSSVAGSGAFPSASVPEAYTMLDATLVRIIGHDAKHLTFARKRMRFGLLNLWVQETQWRLSPIAGDHDEVMRNISEGWAYWGAPYGAPWLARLAGRLELRRYF